MFFFEIILLSLACERGPRLHVCLIDAVAFVIFFFFSSTCYIVFSCDPIFGPPLPWQRHPFPLSKVPPPMPILGVFNPFIQVLPSHRNSPITKAPILPNTLLLPLLASLIPVFALISSFFNHKKRRLMSSHQLFGLRMSPPFFPYFHGLGPMH